MAFSVATSGEVAQQAHGGCQGPCARGFVVAYSTAAVATAFLRTPRAAGAPVARAGVLGGDGGRHGRRLYEEGLGCGAAGERARRGSLTEFYVFTETCTFSGHTRGAAEPSYFTGEDKSSTRAALSLLSRSLT